MAGPDNDNYDDDQYYHPLMDLLIDAACDYENTNPGEQIEILATGGDGPDDPFVVQITRGNFRQLIRTAGQHLEEAGRRYKAT